LPGDDLDLYAVLDLFQKSKTIEAFEKSLNEEKASIVNLDLNNDGKLISSKLKPKKTGMISYLFFKIELVKKKLRTLLL